MGTRNPLSFCECVVSVKGGGCAIDLLEPPFREENIGIKVYSGEPRVTISIRNTGCIERLRG